MKASKPTELSYNKDSNGVNKYNGMFVGFVKDNTDAHRMGRLMVWIPELGSDPDDESGWVVTSFCSPFAGATPTTALNGNDVEEYDNTQTSYGMWFVPPDLENQVTVMFANGDPTRGFWFGCVFQQYMNSMVPGVPSDRSYQHKDERNVPVTEYNKYDTSVNINNTTRPKHTYVTEGVANQGLINDNVRGINTSSSRREAPSQVYGILTPGPLVTEDGKIRKTGHSFVLDDNDESEYVAVKTRSGSQFRLDETNGIVYLINRDGTVWAQMDEDGNFDVFAAKSITMRAREDINFRADRDMNVEVGRDINIKARKDWVSDSDVIGEPGSGDGGNIKIRAHNEFDVKIEKDTRLEIIDGKLDVFVKGDVTTKYDSNLNATVTSATLFKTASCDVKVDADTNIESGVNVNMKSGANTNIESGGDTNIKGGANVNVQGSASIQLNGGGQIVASAGSINLNGPGAAPADSAVSAAISSEPVLALDSTEYTKDDVLTDFKDELNFNRNTNSFSAITPRLATFEPCPDHINKGT